MADTHFEFFTALRGFHVYCNTVNWEPYVGQKISFKREHNNKYDKFAVAGQALLRGRLGEITVGHIPRELSRYTWYAMAGGAKFKAFVNDAKRRPSPLLQGGLEIQIKMEVSWLNIQKLSIYTAKVAEVQYPMYLDYVDSSKAILEELVGHEIEDSDNDEEVESDNEEESNCEEAAENCSDDECMITH